MSEKMQAIVSKVWSMCTVLYNDGVSYSDYLEQITYLMFMKMVDEYSKPPYNYEIRLPKGYAWGDLRMLTGTELEAQYKESLEKIGEVPGILMEIFSGAQNKINEATNLRKIVQMIDEVNWTSMSTDVKGTIYEGLLAKNAEDVKSGAGQYFTPRPLIQAMVECMDPKPMMTVCDPACGSGGFFLAAQKYIVDNNNLDGDQARFLKNETFHGWEIVRSTYRMCLMNMFLHGIGDVNGSIPITRNDALISLPFEKFDIVLTNPPFGKKSTRTFTNEKGEIEREEFVYSRQDFWTTTSNKQMNFVQHINSLLKSTGKAAVVVPDNVLFEGGAGETIRKKLLETTDFHTILRLPTGLFYKQGVKANVIFFDKMPAGPGMKTKEVWIYDMRTNMHFTLKKNPMKFEDLQDFIKCFNPKNRHERVETYSADNPEGRFRRYPIEAILSNKDTSLDISWIKDNSVMSMDDIDDPLELIETYKQEILEYTEKINSVIEQIEKSLGDNN